MEVIVLVDGAKPLPKENLTLALGDFDGVHLGHQKLIQEGKAFADGSPFGVFLFEKDPSLFLPNGKGKQFLTALKDKLYYLERAGADLAYVAEVNEAFFAMSPEAFIENYLLPLGTKKVAVGEDYRFGKGAKGTPETLKNAFDVHVTQLVYEGEEKIASRGIKNLVAEGKIEEANALLGHPYRLFGKIQEGLHNGRKIGFPTINLALSFPYILPKVGVYLGYVELKGGSFPAIINVGSNPTIGILEEAIVEAHLKGFKGNAYGEDCKVHFLSFLREEEKFASLDELKAQLAKDIALLP